LRKVPGLIGRPLGGDKIQVEYALAILDGADERQEQRRG